MKSYFPERPSCGTIQFQSFREIVEQRFKGQLRPNSCPRSCPLDCERMELASSSQVILVESNQDVKLQMKSWWADNTTDPPLDYQIPDDVM